jgi:hypothetical protein
MELPKYAIEPGIPGSITDLIQQRHFETPNARRRIRWTSSYQGATDYDSDIGKRRRLTFRYGKLPWRWSFQKPGEVYWNFASEEEFQHEVNGSWGILHGGSDPVDAETLLAFRELYLPEAVTGYFDHKLKRWVICEPTTQELSNESWKKWKLANHDETGASATK